MPILFEHRVKRMQKWVLGGIVAIMALSLVTWGYSGGDDRDKDANEPAGTFTTGETTVTVTKRDFRRQFYKAGIWIRWLWFREEKPLFGGFRSGPLPPLNERMNLIANPQYGGWRGIAGSMVQQDEATKHEKAWEMLVLVADARAKGFRISESEVQEEITKLFDASGITRDEENQAYIRFVEQFFSAEVKYFQETIAEALLIEKMLAFETAGSPVKYASIYEKVAQGTQRVRVHVAGIDPEPFTRDPRPMGSEVVARHFETNKEKYKEPEKAQVELLMASLATLKAAYEPTEEAIKDYYEKNRKGSFAKPHAHREGEEHREDEPQEYKSLEEVRAEIIDKLKTVKAKEQAWMTIREVNQAIGDMETKHKNELREQLKKELQGDDLKKLEEKVTERLRESTNMWFEDLQKQWQGKGIKLDHDNTSKFDEKHLQTAWEKIGKLVKHDSEEKFKEWLFKRAVVGDIDSAILETDKGFAITRLSAKSASYVPDLDPRIDAVIRKELALEDVMERVRKVAQQVERALNGFDLPPEARMVWNPAAHLREIATKYGTTFRQSGYFGRTQPTSSEEREPTDLGLGEAFLATPVRTHVFGAPHRGDEDLIPVEAGRTFVMDGSDLGADKKLWSYVVFIEDVVSDPPKNAETRFRDEREKLEGEHRGEARAKAIKGIMNWAQLNDKMEKPQGPRPPAGPEGD